MPVGTVCVDHVSKRHPQQLTFGRGIVRRVGNAIENGEMPRRLIIEPGHQDHRLIREL